MATYNELEQRIKELKSRTGKGSISPRETFDLMDELLSKTKGVDMTAQPLVVVKSYDTLALANADRNPINPATNKPLALGQLISITADGANNAVYRLAALAADGSPTWEKQAELGDMTNYAKQTDLVQLAGEKVSSENIMHSVFERVDFSNNSPTLPDGFTIENGSLVFTKAEGMSGNKIAIIPLNIPNRWKAGKYISMRGASVFGNESSITLTFHNSAGTAMINQVIGAIPKSGSRIKAIVNAYDSSTKQVKLNVSINSTALSTGAKVYLNDVVLTDVAINDFRGLIQVISNPALLSETIQSVSTVSTDLDKVENSLDGIEIITDSKDQVNIPDRAISKFGGGSADVSGYTSSNYLDIRGVDRIEMWASITNFATGYCPILFYKNASTAGYLDTLTPIFHRKMPYIVYREAFKEATHIRVSFLTADISTFYLRLIKGSTSSFYEVANEGISAKSVEWVQKNKPSIKVANIGSFSVRKIVDNPVKIDNVNTYLKDYEPINRDLRRPSGRVEVTDTFLNAPEVYHVGKYTGKIYCSGTDYGGLYVADDWADFLSGNTVKISIGNIYAGIVGVREMQNGELVIMGGNALTGGEIDARCGIYVSAGWKTASMTNTPVAFTIKQAWQSKRNAPQDAWGFHVVGNQVLVSEYSVSGTTFENSYVYYSKDFGQTFSAIFDIETQFGNSNNRVPATNYQHIHGCTIDPYWSRLWVFPGESAVNQQVISYSDDEGVTWTHLSTTYMEKMLTGGNYQAMKYCAAHALDTGILMGTDSQPNGMWRFNRINRSMISGSQADCIEEAKRYDLQITNSSTGSSGHERTITHIMGHMTRVMDDNSAYPVIVCSPMVGLYSNIGTPDQSGLVHISYDGVRFWEIWRETDAAFKAPENFKDNNMKAFAYKDGTIYILAKYFDGGSVRNRIVKGVLPEAY